MKQYVSRRSVVSAAILFALFPLFWLLSTRISGAYTEGDQVWYRALYDSLHGAYFGEIRSYQSRLTSSVEPVLGALYWLGSNLSIQKDVYLGLWNALLLSLVVLHLRKYRASLLFSFLLLLNYYLWVLLFAADRLKFAYIFLLVAALSGNRIVKFMASSISVFSHFQIIIQWASIAAARIAEAVRLRADINKNKLIRYSILLLAALFFALYLGAQYSEFISSKAIRYADAYGGGVMSLVNILILLVVGVVVLERRLDFLAGLIPLAIAAYLLGPERVNMMAVFLFIVFALEERKTSNLAVISLMIYFAIKAMGFLYNIYYFGHGYPR